jgi:hypothetical protein
MYPVGWTTHADAAIFFVSPREVRQFNLIERHIGEKCMLSAFALPF